MFVRRDSSSAVAAKGRRCPRLVVAAFAMCLAVAGLAGPAFAANPVAANQRATDRSAADKAPSAPLLVALGDSFTSGVGLNQLDPTSGDCRRGTASYPLDAARRLGINGSNAACSGAEVSAITTSFRGQSPQVSKVGDADFVAMTIGGNDIISLSNATNLFVDESKVTAELALLAPKLRDAYSAVSEAAPNATVMVLAYPDLFPEAGTGTCPSIVEAALPTAHRAFELLNATIEAEAKAAGVQFVDTSKVLEGHDVCSSEPWATGLDDLSIALHPNDAGHKALGAAVSAEIEPLLAKTDASPTQDSTLVKKTNAAPAESAAVEDDTAVLGQAKDAQPSSATPESPATESLPNTGVEAFAALGVGCGLMGVGFGLVWMRMLMTSRLRLAPVRPPVRR